MNQLNTATSRSAAYFYKSRQCRCFFYGKCVNNQHHNDKLYKRYTFLTVLSYLSDWNAIYHLHEEGHAGKCPLDRQTSDRFKNLKGTFVASNNFGSKRHINRHSIGSAHVISNAQKPSPSSTAKIEPTGRYVHLLAQLCLLENIRTGGTIGPYSWERL